MTAQTKSEVKAVLLGAIAMIAFAGITILGLYLASIGL